MRIRRPHVPRWIRAVFHRKKGEGEFFAWWPRRLDNGTWVWLETVTRYKTYSASRRRR